MHRSDMLQERRRVYRISSVMAVVNPKALDLTTTLKFLLFFRKQVLLWILSDQRLGFCVLGGRSSGQTRWLHKHTVAWGAAEVHSALDSPVVLTCGRVKQN